MKILLINTLYYPYVLGGAERSVQFLAEALAKNGDEPVVVSVNQNSGVKTRSINGVKIYYLGIKNLYNPFITKGSIKLFKPIWNIVDTYNPWMAREIGWILDMEHPDLVHTNNLASFSVSTWSTVKRRKLPLIHTLRDYYLLCPRSTMFFNGKNCTTQCWYCRIYALMRKRISNIVNAVVGNSHYIIDRHLNQGYFTRSKVREVIFSAYPATSRLVVNTIQEDRPLRLGYLGRLTPHKGIELLLQSLKNLPQEEYELWIGGKGPGNHERRLKACYTMPNAYFLGFVDPEWFFNNIDILVVPSLWNDPLPRTIFEAYGNGVPVIGSNRGGIPEVIDTGTTGYLFDPDQPETLLSLCVQIKKNPTLLVQMRKNVIRKFLEFEPERSLSKYMTVYRRAMG